MQMENQPTTNRQWFRLASQARMELPPPMPPPAPAPAPAGPPPPRRGPPIRLASIALARSNLALETTTAPAPERTQTQPSPPPPPVPAVAPPTSALLRAPTTIPAVESTPPASVPSTTMTPPRTITPPTTITLPRTVTPPSVPAPPKTQTPPPAAEPSEGKFYEELTPAPVTEPPKPATLLPPTAAIVPPAQRPPSTRNISGSDSNLEKPLMPTSDTVPVFLRPVATRALTPPESPKVIKASSPTPPQSPRIKSQQSATNLLLAAQPKSIGLQDNPDGNYGPKSSAGGQGGELPKFIKQQAEARNAPSPSPKKEEKNATMLTGKAFATRKDDEKEMRIVTIAGENCGAIMDLGSGHQLNGRKQQVHDPKSHDGESRNMSNAISTTKPMISLANSNVQCVNNSILFNASSVNRNPGVHIKFTRRHREQNTASSAPRGAHLSVD